MLPEMKGEVRKIAEEMVSWLSPMMMMIMMMMMLLSEPMPR